MKKSHEIFTHHNRSAFLHIYYEIPVKDPTFQKIKFWAGKTENGTTIADSAHYLDHDEVRHLAYTIMAQMDEGERWTSFKGYSKGETVVSRILTLNRGKDSDSEKWFIQIGHGPGQQVTQDYIEPLKGAPKQAWTYAKLVFGREEITKLALNLNSWITAITCAEAYQLRWNQE